MDFFGVILGILVLCVANIFVYSWILNDNGLKLSAGIPFIKQNDQLSANNIDKNNDNTQIQKDNSEANTGTSASPNSYSAKELSYITHKLEELLKNVSFLQQNSFDKHRNMRNSMNGQTAILLNPANTNNAYSIADLKNKLEKMVVSTKIRQFNEILNAQSKKILNNPPINSIATIPVRIVTNFTNGVPQVTLTPAQLHILLKNLHVLTKRNIGNGFQLPTDEYSAFDGRKVPYNPYQQPIETNPDQAVLKYIVSPAIQHNLLYSHLPPEFHLLPQNHPRYARTSGDVDKCSPGSRWVMSCRECSCNEDGHIICVKKFDCGLKELVTNCTPLTKFALNLCIECICDTNAIPRCYSICNIKQIHNNIGVQKDEASVDEI